MVDKWHKWQLLGPSGACFAMGILAAGQGLSILGIFALIMLAAGLVVINWAWLSLYRLYRQLEDEHDAGGD